MYACAAWCCAALVLSWCQLAAAGPPAYTPPALPSARLQAIWPTHKDVGEDVTLTLFGEGFTEEFGVGTLQCRFTYRNSSGEFVLRVQAYRDLRGCSPTVDDQLTCETRRAFCTLPGVPDAQKVDVQIANDVEVKVESRGDRVWELVPWEPVWSAVMTFTFVPVVAAVQPSWEEFDAPTRLLQVHGDGFAPVPGFQTVCVFENAGPGGLFPPPRSLENETLGDAEFFQVSNATIVSTQLVECDAPPAWLATELRVRVSPDFLGADAGACAGAHPCRQAGNTSATFYFVARTHRVTPDRGPLAAQQEVLIEGTGFRRNDVQVVRSSCPDDEPVGGHFTLALGAGGQATPPLPYNVSEAALQAELEAAAPALRVRVARARNSTCGAYDWVVWFARSDALAAAEPAVPALTVRDNGLLPPAAATGHGTQLQVLSPARCEFSGFDRPYVEHAVAVDDRGVSCIVPNQLDASVDAHIRVAFSYAPVFSVDHGAAVYRYYPALRSIHPWRGGLHGGTEVFVTGSGFSDAKPLRCLFLVEGAAEGNASVPAHFESPTRVRCRSPPAELVHPLGLAVPTHLGDDRVVLVEVSQNNGSVYSDTAEMEDRFQRGRILNRFAYYVLPIIDRIYPLTGPAMGGTRVTLFGRHFNRSAVQFCHWEVEAADAERRAPRAYPVFTPARYYGDGMVTCDTPRHYPPAEPTDQRAHTVNVRLLNDALRPDDRDHRPPGWDQPLFGAGDFSNPVRFTFLPDVRVSALRMGANPPLALDEPTQPVNLTVHAGGQIVMEVHADNLFPDLRKDGQPLELAAWSAEACAAALSDSGAAPPACWAPPQGVPSYSGFALLRVETGGAGNGSAALRNVSYVEFTPQYAQVQATPVLVGAEADMETIAALPDGIVVGYRLGRQWLRAQRFDHVGGRPRATAEFPLTDRPGCAHPSFVRLSGGFLALYTCDNATTFATLFRWSPVNYTALVETPYLRSLEFPLDFVASAGPGSGCERLDSGDRVRVALVGGDHARVYASVLDLAAVEEDGWDTDASLFTRRNRYLEHMELVSMATQVLGQHSAQRPPAAALLERGQGFAATWHESEAAVRVARLDVNGTLLMLERANTKPRGRVRSPHISALEAGFVVVWQADGHEAELGGIVGQRYAVNSSHTWRVGLHWWEHHPRGWALEREDGTEFFVHDDRTRQSGEPSLIRMEEGGVMVVYNERVLAANASGTDPPGPVDSARLLGQRMRDIKLQCRFGEVTVFANLLTPTLARCVVPPHDPGPMPVAITTNGFDFAPSGIVLHNYGTCPAGFYCPDRTQQGRPDAELVRPCPLGHRCPYENMHDPEPCPFGEYQDEEEQLVCDPCDIGHQCPRRGMAAPELCEAGYVCDRVGTITSAMLCPQGHYCWPGTAINATDCCYQSAPGDVCDCYQAASPFLGDPVTGLPATWTQSPVYLGDAVIADERRLVLAVGAFAVDEAVAQGFKLILNDSQASEAHVVDTLRPLNGSAFWLSAPSSAFAPGAQVSVHWQMHGVVDKFAAVPGRPLRCEDSFFCGPGVVSNVSVFCTDATRPDCYLTPQKCREGFRCEAGSKTPHGTALCPPGFFKPYELNTTSGEYLPPAVKCRLAQYSEHPLAFYLRTGCGGVDCGPGEFCVLNATSARCQPPDRYFCDCPRGHFCPGFGNAEPTPCRPGKHNLFTSQPACFDCPLGHTCPRLGMVQAQKCAPGYICDTTGLSLERELCTPGFFCLEGVRTPDSSTTRVTDRTSSVFNEVTVLLAQPGDTYVAHDPAAQPAQAVRFALLELYEEIELFRVQLVRVAANASAVANITQHLRDRAEAALQTLTAARIPFACPKGFFCLSGVRTPIPVPGDYTTPQLCVAGYLCKIGAAATTGTRKCPPGHFCPTGTHAPHPAPPGYFAPGLGNKEATPCFAGTFTPQFGRDVCGRCPKGFYCPGVARNDTVIAPAGRVVSRTRQSTATRGCPAGFYCPEATISACTELDAPSSFFDNAQMGGRWELVLGSDRIRYDFGGGEAPADCEENFCDLREYVNPTEAVLIGGHFYDVLPGDGYARDSLQLDRPLESPVLAGNMTVQLAACSRCTFENTCGQKYAQGSPDAVALPMGPFAAVPSSAWQSRDPHNNSLTITTARAVAPLCDGREAEFLFDGRIDFTPSASPCLGGRGLVISPPQSGSAAALDIEFPSPTTVDFVRISFALSPATTEASAAHLQVTGLLDDSSLVTATANKTTVANGVVTAEFYVPRRYRETVFVSGSHYDFWDMQPLRSAGVAVRPVGSGAQPNVHLLEVQVFVRDAVYVPGSIMLALRAKAGERAPVDCCARPVPCPEGTYCLSGVATGEVDFKGGDFTAPQWCIEGTYCGLASRSPTGSGLCPAGYYCPKGTPRPRPCWKGHQCAGEGNAAPTPCARGTYSPYGPFPPYTQLRLFDVEDPLYPQHVYSPAMGTRRCTSYCCAAPCADCLPPAYPGGPKQSCSGAMVRSECLIEQGRPYGCVGEAFDFTRSIPFGGRYDWEWFPSRRGREWVHEWTTAANPSNPSAPEFAVGHCPRGELLDCDGRCVKRAQCLGEARDVRTCDALLGDGVCHDGSVLTTADGAAPNFDCAQFDFDAGDCPRNDRPDLRQLALRIVDVVVCANPDLQCAAFRPSAAQLANAADEQLRGLQQAAQRAPLDAAVCAFALAAPPARTATELLASQLLLCGEASLGLTSAGNAAVWPWYSRVAGFENTAPASWPGPSLEYLAWRGVSGATWAASGGVRDITTEPWHLEDGPGNGTSRFHWRSLSGGPLRVVPVQDELFGQLTHGLAFPESAATMAPLSALTLFGSEVERQFLTQYRNLTVELAFAANDELGNSVLFATGSARGAGFAILLRGSALHVAVQCANSSDVAGLVQPLALRAQPGTPGAAPMHHVAVVMALLGPGKHPHITLLHNGRPVASASHDNVTCDHWADDSPTVIGTRAGPGGEPVPGQSAAEVDAFANFNGTIALLRLYSDQALTTHDIRANMRALPWRFPPPASPIAGGRPSVGSDDLIGAARCLPCPDGHFCSSEQTILPVRCGAGTYRNRSESIGCRACPEGTYGYRLGLRNSSECGPCPPGVVCLSEGVRDLGDPRRVAPCPAGFFCPQGTRKSDQYAYPCAAGKFCIEGTRPPADFGYAGSWRLSDVGLQRRGAAQGRALCAGAPPRGDMLYSVVKGVSEDCRWEYEGAYTFDYAIPAGAAWEEQALGQRSNGAPAVLLDLVRNSTNFAGEIVTPGYLQGVLLGSKGALFAVVEQPVTIARPGSVVSRTQRMLALFFCGNLPALSPRWAAVEHAPVPKPLTDYCLQRIDPRAPVVPEPSAGPFFLCPAGYECRAGTGANDESRLRFPCEPGVPCPPGTPGPITYSCEGTCRRRAPVVERQWRFNGTTCAAPVVVAFGDTGETVQLPPTLEPRAMEDALNSHPAFVEAFVEAELRWLASRWLDDASGEFATTLTLLRSPYEASPLAATVQVTRGASSPPCPDVLETNAERLCCTPQCLGRSLRASCDAADPLLEMLRCPAGSTTAAAASDISLCRVDWRCLAQQRAVFDKAARVDNRTILVTDALVTGSCPAVVEDEVFVAGAAPSKVTDATYSYGADSVGSQVRVDSTLPTWEGVRPLLTNGQPQSILNTLAGCSVWAVRDEWGADESPTEEPAPCSYYAPPDIAQHYAVDLAQQPLRVLRRRELPPVYLPEHMSVSVLVDLRGAPNGSEYNNHYWISLYLTPPLTAREDLIERVLLPQGFEVLNASVNYRALHEFRIVTRRAVELRVAIEILHGAYDRRSDHLQFERCISVSFRPGWRAQQGTDLVWLAAISKVDTMPEDDTVPATILPVNLPLFDIGTPPRGVRGARLSYAGKGDELLVGDPSSVFFDSGNSYWRSAQQSRRCAVNGTDPACARTSYRFQRSPDGSNGRPYFVSNGRVAAAGGVTVQYYVPQEQYVPLRSLPYIGNCKRLGSDVTFASLFEDPELCSLVRRPERDVTVVGSWPDGRGDLGAPSGAFVTRPGTADPLKTLVSDRCDYTVQCLYEEYQSTPRELGANYWWMERSPELPLFYLFRDPLPRSLADDELNVMRRIQRSRDNVVPVTSVYETHEGTDNSLRYVPTSVRLEVGYFQRTPTLKRLVSARLYMSDFIDTANGTACSSDNRDYSCEARRRTYRFTVRFTPLPWLALYDRLALPATVYEATFLLIALAAGAALLATQGATVGLGLVRRRLRPAAWAVDCEPDPVNAAPGGRPPGSSMASIALRVLLRPLGGFVLAAVITSVALVVVVYLIVTERGPNFLDQFPADQSLMREYGSMMMDSCEQKLSFREVVNPGINCLTETEIMRARGGRYGMIFLVLSTSAVGACIALLVPDYAMQRFLAWKEEHKEELSTAGKTPAEKQAIKDAIAEAHERFLPYGGDAWNPASWRRSHLRFATVMEVLLFLFLIEVSNLLDANLPYVMVLIKIARWASEGIILSFVHDALLAAPFYIAFALLELMVALTSSGFVQFIALYTAASTTEVVRRALVPALLRWLYGTPIDNFERLRQRRDQVVWDVHACVVGLSATWLSPLLVALLYPLRLHLPLVVISMQHALFVLTLAPVLTATHLLAFAARDAAYGTTTFEYLARCARHWGEQLLKTQPPGAGSLPRGAAAAGLKPPDRGLERMQVEERRAHLQLTLALDESLRAFHETRLNLFLFATASSYGMAIALVVTAAYLLKTAGGVDAMFPFAAVFGIVLAKGTRIALSKVAAAVHRDSLPRVRELSYSEAFYAEILEACEKSSGFEDLRVQLLAKLEHRLRVVMQDRERIAQENKGLNARAVVQLGGKDAVLQLQEARAQATPAAARLQALRPLIAAAGLDDVPTAIAVAAQGVIPGADMLPEITRGAEDWPVELATATHILGEAVADSLHLRVQAERILPHQPVWLAEYVQSRLDQPRASFRPRAALSGPTKPEQSAGTQAGGAKALTTLLSAHQLRERHRSRKEARAADATGGAAASPVTSFSKDGKRSARAGTLTRLSIATGEDGAAAAAAAAKEDDRDPDRDVSIGDITLLAKGRGRHTGSGSVGAGEAKRDIEGAADADEDEGAETDEMDGDGSEGSDEEESEEGDEEEEKEEKEEDEEGDGEVEGNDDDEESDEQSAMHRRDGSSIGDGADETQNESSESTEDQSSDSSHGAQSDP